jgi:anti-sigma regulatory factor (Ser/Thr protein kinase)
LARRFVVKALRRHGLESLVDVAQLLTSEAVTNAVVHAGSTCTLTMTSAEDCIHIQVEDRGRGTIALRRSSPTSTTGGRGLFIIDRLAARWGVSETVLGNTVWFDVPFVARV